MRTITYKSMLEGTLRLAGIDPANSPATSDKLKVMEKLHQALKQGHEHWRWPELTPTEERFYRAVHVYGTTYAAPTTTVAVEVYFPATDTYYQSLRVATNQYPATLSGSTYVLNSAYWAESDSSYDGPDWLISTAYAVADVVRNPEDGRFYCCHTAHTSAGSGTIDTAKFGVLTVFRKVVIYEQSGKTAIEAVIGAWDKDPRTQTDAIELEFAMDNEGVEFGPDGPSSVWIQFRIRCPDFTYYAEWSATNFTSGQQVYYPTTGELYRAAAAMTSGQVPGTHANWVKIDVPYWLEVPCKRWAHALFAGSDGSNRKGLLTEEEFRDLLDEQVWQFTKLQGQQGRVTRK